MNSTKSIRICLRGGLGNLLHQISFSMWLEQKGLKSQFDLSLISNLDDLSILSKNLQEYVEKRIVKRTKYYPSFTGPLAPISRIVNTLEGFQIQTEDTSAVGRNLNYESGNLYTGYFQRIEWSIPLKNFLIKEERHWDRYENAIALHIRLGDYVGNVSQVPIAYFSKLLEEFQKDDFYKYLAIRIFSNDIVACRKKLDEQFSGLEYVYSGNGLEDLIYLSQHRVIACSRSTYSWWAGFLNNKAKKILPSPWFVQEQDTDNLIVPSDLNWLLRNIDA